MKRVLLLMICMFFISFVSAEVQTLGEFDVNTTVNLIQSCQNSTYSNVTGVYHEGEYIIKGNFPMTKDGNDYNLSFSNTSDYGQYLVYGNCDEDGINTNWVYDFIIGKTPQSSWLISGLLVVLLVFFILALIGLFNFESYTGRFALYWVCHVLMIGITFLAWNLAGSYLTEIPAIIGLFKIAFFFFMIGAFPMLILSLAWVFYVHTVNDNMRNLMEKGMDPDKAFKRSSGGFKW